MPENTNNIFDDDKLERKNVAEHFKNILLNTNLNVFSLVAPWGCGKTYFIKNLIKMMDDNSINILYNAWESDFYDSPLIPLLVELLNKIETSCENSEVEEDIKSIKESMKNLCNKTSFQIGLNIGIANCSANFDPNKKAIESEYIELKKLIQDFKKNLKILQEKLNQKIIIFIDELDRCNPLYTIKTLEVIKHFFGIPNVIFVLAVDKTQIENSVRTIYGINQGAENGYLRKFIDVEFQLPKPNKFNFINFHLSNIWDKITYFIENEKYYNYHERRIINNFGYQKGIDHLKEQQFIALHIEKTLNILNFSLRDIEKYFIRFSLLLDELHDKDILFIMPCIVLNALAINNNDDFDNYLNSNMDNRLKNLSIEILPLWNGLFKNSYKRILSKCNETARNNTIESNVEQLYDFLHHNISNDTNTQEQYLQEYPTKIKFINNFTTL